MCEKIVLTVAEVADILNFSKDFTYTLFRREDFPLTSIGQPAVCKGR